MPKAIGRIMGVLKLLCLSSNKLLNKLWIVGVLKSLKSVPVLEQAVPVLEQPRTTSNKLSNWARFDARDSAHGFLLGF